METPQVTPARTAEFTTEDADEVMLNYVQDWGQQHGTKQIAFYSWQNYKAKQTQHGKELYPDVPEYKRWVAAKAKIKHQRR